MNLKLLGLLPSLGKSKINVLIKSTIFYRVKCALFLKENCDEILPAYYTWKVPEKGFKITWVMC
jgi:hypothetical protein